MAEIRIPVSLVGKAGRAKLLASQAELLALAPVLMWNGLLASLSSSP